MDTAWLAPLRTNERDFKFMNVDREMICKSIKVRPKFSSYSILKCNLHPNCSRIDCPLRYVISYSVFCKTSLVNSCYCWQNKHWLVFPPNYITPNVVLLDKIWKLIFNSLLWCSLVEKSNYILCCVSSMFIFRMNEDLFVSLLFNFV